VGHTLNQAHENVISEARLAHQSGDSARALSLLNSVLSHTGAPIPVGALQLAGVVCAKLSRFTEAASYFEQAAQQDASGQSWLNAAACLNKLNEHNRELAALEACVELAPNHLLAQGLLAELAQRLGRIDRAIRARFVCARLEPAQPKHLQRAVDLACTDLDNFTPMRDENVITANPHTNASEIDMIVCSIDTRRLDRLKASLKKTWGTNYNLIHISDAKSLAEGYTRGLAMSSAEHVVLCHDDIEFLDIPVLAGMAHTWPERIAHHLKTFDVIGVAGTSKLTTTVVMGSGTGHVHGWISHPSDEPGTLKNLTPTGYIAGLFSSQTAPIKVEALDGVFIAARRSVFNRVQFDSVTFNGFHGYDIDLTYRCYQAGLNIAVCPDLWLMHLSAGHFGDQWVEYSKRLLKKFPTLTEQKKSPLYFAHGVHRWEQLQAAYERLWTASDF
jgi:hypothetical protein